MSEHDVFAVLEQIERGEVTLTLVEPGYLVEYEANNGWAFRVRVFDDCGEWDYIDSYRRPGGRWERASSERGGVLWWEPRNLEAWPWL